MSSAAPKTLHPSPDRIGRYEVLGLLGSGGMANVWLGRLRAGQSFERLVAIKVLHPHLAEDEVFAQMFEDEARVAARLHHPNVVPILELGGGAPEDPSPRQLYLVMDYIEGDTLAAVQSVASRARRGIPLGIVLRVVLDALGGLDAAHHLTGPDGKPLNLVHRDVSPQNILVGSDGVARLTDFGIARADGVRSTTRAGALKGKAAFMAPEQLTNEPLDHRADVFAMGVTLWEAIGLRRMFPERADLGSFTSVSREPYQALQGFVQDVPEALDAICATAVSPQPRNRFASAGAMLEAIERDLRAHLASHREVARLMAAVAAPKVRRERALILAANAPPKPTPSDPPLDPEPALLGAASAPQGMDPAPEASELPAPLAVTVVAVPEASVTEERASIPSPESVLESRVRPPAPVARDLDGEGGTLVHPRATLAPPGGRGWRPPSPAHGTGRPPQEVKKRPTTLPPGFLARAPVATPPSGTSRLRAPTRPPLPSPTPTLPSSAPPAAPKRTEPAFLPRRISSAPPEPTNPAVHTPASATAAPPAGPAAHPPASPAPPAPFELRASGPSQEPEPIPLVAQVPTLAVLEAEIPVEDEPEAPASLLDLEAPLKVPALGPPDPVQLTLEAVGYSAPAREVRSEPPEDDGSFKVGLLLGVGVSLLVGLVLLLPRLLGP
ncbi:MAG: protein kinase [Deltaproteobacteria bacterium]|nr:protein kinase [Deltaproteobacteria bacterium]